MARTIRKKKLSPVVIFIIIVAVLYVVTEIVPFLMAKTVPTVIVKHEELVVEEEVECYAIRSETLYSAPYSAKTEYNVENGELIKVGTKVLDLNRSDRDFSSNAKKYEDFIRRAGKENTENVEYAQRKGIFTTFADGNEDYFTMKNYKNITEEQAEKRADDTIDVKEKNAAEKQPLYKITDQSEIVLVCWIESGSVSRYREGDVVEVRFDDETGVKFVIDRIDKEGSKWKMRLSSNRYFKEFADFRSKKVSIVSSDTEGLKIPNSSITTEKGVVGVYVGDKSGEFSFIPVKIVTSDGEYSIIKGNIYYDDDGKLVNTVRIYDEILKKPKTKEK